MAKLPITNTRDVDVLLFLEPYGADYWLKPGEELIVVTPESSLDPIFEVHVTSDGVTVYFEGRDAWVTGPDGTRHEVGYQRPPGRFESDHSG